MFPKLVPAALLLACAAVYADQLGGPLLFDDQQALVDNASIRSLHLPEVLMPPRETPVAGRPLANLSFALNYASTRLSPTALHATNLLVHMLVVALAFVLLRALFEHGRVPRRVREHALGLASTTALLFAVHPLCVELVLYATQRTESLAALFYLTTFYVLTRAAIIGRVRGLHVVLALVAAWLGALSKEVFATAPLLALFYDRAFFGGSFARSLRARWPIFLALASSWIPLLFLQRTHPRPGSVRFLELDYLLAQSRILFDYLRVAAWPARPALDYGPLLPEATANLVPFVMAALLLVSVASVLAFAKPRLGFLGAAVLGILAPTSTLFSIHSEVGAERRMYLPLLVLLGYVVVGLEASLERVAQRWLRSAEAGRVLRTGCLLVAALTLGLSARAYAATFASAQSAWRAAVVARPRNPRAHYNLAETYRREGRLPAAIASFRAAIALDPGYANAYLNLGGVLLSQGQPLAALQASAHAARLAPLDAAAQRSYGLALAFAGHAAEASLQLTKASALAPRDPDTRSELAGALLIAGDLLAARAQLAWLAQHAPTHPRLAALQQRLQTVEETAVTTLDATPWPEAKLFQPSGPWLGADSAYSIDLGDRRVLWLFGDTFLDPRADGSRENGPNFFVRNTAALQTGSHDVNDANDTNDTNDATAYDPARAKLSYFWGPTVHGAPSSFFHDVDGHEHWLWPLHGARLPDGELLLFRLHLVAQAGGFGFAVRGSDAVAIDNASDSPATWQPRVIMPVPAVAGSSPVLGSSVLVHDNYLYAYAVDADPKRHAIYVARFPLAALHALRSGALDEPQWWCGSAGFVRASAATRPVALFDDGQIELSVSYVQRIHRFVEIQTRGGLLGDPNTAIVARFAVRPEGPWSPVVAFHRPREAARSDAASLLSYAAKAHPEQRGADLIVTYVVNDLRPHTPADALYYPQLLRVQVGDELRPASAAAR